MFLNYKVLNYVWLCFLGNFMSLSILVAFTSPRALSTSSGCNKMRLRKQGPYLHSLDLNQPQHPSQGGSNQFCLQSVMQILHSKLQYDLHSLPLGCDIRGPWPLKNLCRRTLCSHNHCKEEWLLHHDHHNGIGPPMGPSPCSVRVTMTFLPSLLQFMSLPFHDHQLPGKLYFVGAILSVAFAICPLQRSTRASTKLPAVVIGNSPGAVREPFRTISLLGRTILVCASRL